MMPESSLQELIEQSEIPHTFNGWLQCIHRSVAAVSTHSARGNAAEKGNYFVPILQQFKDNLEIDNDNDNDNDDNVVEKKEVIKEDEEGNKEMKEGDLVAKECLETTNEVKSEEEMVKKTNVDEKAASEVSKDSDISVVSSQPSSRGEEEDLGWDEIEDLGSDDDEDVKKGKRIEGSSSSPSNKEELLKRLSVAEDDDEDLSWDIEDDDEPIKKS